MEKTRNHWNLCPTCKQIAFGLKKHECPLKVRAKIDAEVDMQVDDQLMTWDKDVREFWESSDVKFYQWELKNNE